MAVGSGVGVGGTTVGRVAVGVGVGLGLGVGVGGTTVGRVAVGAAAAVLAILFVLPGRGEVEAQGARIDAYGLVPRDPLALTLAREDTPPSMETVIALLSSEQRR